MVKLIIGAITLGVFVATGWLLWKFARQLPPRQIVAITIGAGLTAGLALFAAADKLGLLKDGEKPHSLLR